MFGSLLSTKDGRNKFAKVRIFWVFLSCVFLLEYTFWDTDKFNL